MAVSETLQKLLEGKSWTHEQPLVSGDNRLTAVLGVCRCEPAWCAGPTGSLPSARRRATGTRRQWLSRLAQGTCHCTWQELEVRPTRNSAQFQSGIYRSNLLFAVMPKAVGQLGLCWRLVMLRSLGGGGGRRLWDAHNFMFRLQSGVPAGKSRAVQESGQEVLRARRVPGLRAVVAVGSTGWGFIPAEAACPAALPADSDGCELSAGRRLLCSWSIFLFEIIFPRWEL